MRGTPMDHRATATGNAQRPIDGSAADAHVDIGRILPSQGLCLDPLIHLAIRWIRMDHGYV